MNEAAASARHAAGTVGRFNYLDASVPASLYRTGKVLTRRDADGSDAGTSGVVLAAHEMTVHDVRNARGSERCTLERNGFQLLTRPLAGSIDFFDHERILSHYYPHCVELVQAFTGGRAFAFDHNVRSAGGKQRKQRLKGGQEVQGPAHVVHGDYTLTSAPQRLRDLTKPPTGNDTLRAVLGANQSLIELSLAAAALEGDARFAIVNVWRNITETPVATHPLALCDGRSVEPEDLVVFEIHYADRIGENYFAKHAAKHRWCYFPHVTRDEALLIKQWDSHGTLATSKGARADAADADAPCTFSFHSAFADPSTPPDAPDRWSIEVRCMVLYP